MQMNITMSAPMFTNLLAVRHYVKEIYFSNVLLTHVAGTCPVQMTSGTLGNIRLHTLVGNFADSMLI